MIPYRNDNLIIRGDASFIITPELCQHCAFRRVRLSFKSKSIRDSVMTQLCNIQWIRSCHCMKKQPSQCMECGMINKILINIY